jgi:hypothetical protein
LPLAGGELEDLNQQKRRTKKMLELLQEYEKAIIIGFMICNVFLLMYLTRGEIT